MDMSSSISQLAPLILELKRWYGHVQRLKAENLVSTEVRDMTAFPPPNGNETSGNEKGRSLTGIHTHPEKPAVGALGARFARNVPLEYAIPESDPEKEDWDPGDPDPRLISRELLHRKDGNFIPAKQVNLLAAAWIQFQVHDWFGHEEHEGRDKEVKFQNDKGLPKLNVFRTRVDRGDDGKDKAKGKGKAKVGGGTDHRPHPEVPAFINTQTHWWDGSQIYGSENPAPREGPKKSPKAELKLVANEETGDFLLPLNEDSQGKVHPRKPEITGLNDNWWLGLSLLHSLFAREHNAICHALRTREPRFQGEGKEDAIYECARLVNTALIAKIHTTEWTPAMLKDRPIQIALLADWWGIGDRDLLQTTDQLFKHLSKIGVSSVEAAFKELMAPTDERTEALRGELDQKLTPYGIDEFLQGLADILRGYAPRRRTKTDMEPFDEAHYRNNPVYAMTEEFTAIYRMHSLAPDEIEILAIGERPAPGENLHERIPFLDCAGKGARDLVEEHGLARLFYSFGNTHPGALVLDISPANLPKFTTDTASNKELDLAAVDILRDRERGVPRYTRFRKLLRGDTIVTFEDLTGASEPGLEQGELLRRRKLADRLREVYKKDNETDKEAVDRVDLQVGLLAEPLRKGFAFSETTFYVFTLMAPLRLRSDRFYTSDYGEELYTRTGLDWINENTMKTVLARHFEGELAGTLMEIRNVFEPWSAEDNSDVSGLGPAAA